MVRATFYMHQNSGAYPGVCMCDRMHQIKKTAIVSHRERNALICFNEKVQINNVKMETFSIHPPACLPACPYFSNCDQHKPNKFAMAAPNSSDKLHDFCM